jgi:serine/threonine-protein kinase
MQSAASVDERSDIWSLGLVLFELLAGYCPFESDSIPETCWKVLQGPRPSLLEARTRLAPGLERIFQRCIARDPAERFRSVGHLAAALRPFAKPAAHESGVRPVVVPTPPPARARRSRSEQMLWAAMFLLGAGVASAAHALEARFVERGVALNSASSALLAQVDWLRRALPESVSASLLGSAVAAPPLQPSPLEPSLAAR